MDFNSLIIEVNEPSLPKVYKYDKPKLNLLTSKRLDFGKDILNIQPKKKKEELRIIEPGFKVGTGQFLSVSQYCDTCQCVQGHAHKPEKRRMICLTCKCITKY